MPGNVSVFLSYCSLSYRISCSSSCSPTWFIARDSLQLLVFLSLYTSSVLRLQEYTTVVGFAWVIFNSSLTSRGYITNSLCHLYEIC